MLWNSSTGMVTAGRSGAAAGSRMGRETKLPAKLNRQNARENASSIVSVTVKAAAFLFAGVSGMGDGASVWRIRKPQEGQRSAPGCSRWLQMGHFIIKDHLVHGKFTQIPSFLS